MQILITDGPSGHLSQLRFGWGLGILAALLAIVLIGTASYAGYLLGSAESDDGQLAASMKQDLYISQSLTDELYVQKIQVNAAVDDAQDNLNALAMRLGLMQAKVTRLEAMGARLTRVAGLSTDEFDFETTPPIGGVEDTENQREFIVPDFIQSLETLSDKIDEREQQLSVLDAMLLFNKLELAAVPAGNPVSDSWVSSNFGSRTDPMTGKHDFHKGIDLAGDEGSEVNSVAAGVVIWSGEQKGYGNVIEIDHGHGYLTRYAHNAKNLVKIGDKVEKGQSIALMGSTGRSTGPHVHFEVEQNGKVIDPMPYLKPLG